MKKSIGLSLVLALLLTFNLFAQDKKITNIVSFSPSYTQVMNAAHPPFPILIDKNYLKYNSNIYALSSKDPNYSNYSLSIAFTRDVRSDIFVKAGWEFGSDNYSYTLNYFTFGVLGQSSISEKIKGTTSKQYLDLGKAFYFLKDKKLMVQPYMQGYVSIFAYDRETQTTTYSSISQPNKTNGMDLTAGGGLGLVVNYQLAKHFGLGINFDNLYAYQLRNKTDNALSTETDRILLENSSHFAPRLSLLYYFKTNK